MEWETVIGLEVHVQLATKTTKPWPPFESGKEAAKLRDSPENAPLAAVPDGQRRSV